MVDGYQAWAQATSMPGTNAQSHKGPMGSVSRPHLTAAQEEVPGSERQHAHRHEDRHLATVTAPRDGRRDGHQERHRGVEHDLQQQGPRHALEAKVHDPEDGDPPGDGHDVRRGQPDQPAREMVERRDAAVEERTRHEIAREREEHHHALVQREPRGSQHARVESRRDPGVEQQHPDRRDDAHDVEGIVSFALSHRLPTMQDLRTGGHPPAALSGACRHHLRDASRPGRAAARVAVASSRPPRCHAHQHVLDTRTAGRRHRTG